jgi:hypothetical protein
VNWLRLQQGMMREGEGGAGGGGGGGNPPPEPAWHEAIVTKADDGTESLTDFTAWKDKAPAPLVKFITDNMTAARAKTEGMVKVPGENATPEERAAFYRSIGAPEKPEDYGIAKPDDLPEGVTWDDNLAASFAAKAASLGLTKQQAKELQAFQLENVKQSQTQMRAAAENALKLEKEELTKTFGAGLDAAVVAAQKVGALPDINIPKEAFDPSHNDFWGVSALSAFSKLAAKIGEHALHSGSGASAGGEITLAEAKNIMNNKDHPLHAKWNAGDKDVAAKVKRAYEKGV